MSPRNTKDGGRRGSKKGGQENVFEDDEYRKRRERNNEAVKKSREKSKVRTKETLQRVHKLKNENEMLEEKIKILSKELDFLKELFFAHTGTPAQSGIDQSQLELLLKATAQDDTDNVSRRTRKTSTEDRKDHSRA